MRRLDFTRRYTDREVLQVLSSVRALRQAGEMLRTCSADEAPSICALHEAQLQLLLDADRRLEAAEMNVESPVVPEKSPGSDSPFGVAAAPELHLVRGQS